MKVAVINNSLISKGDIRMEGKFFLNENSLLCMPLERNLSKCVALESIADVMNPPVFKRQFCSPTERAVQYFQSSDVNLAAEYSSVYVYKPQAERIKAIVHKGDILVTGFGTIGNTRLVSKHQDGVCYANNVARIRTKGEVLNGYIYAFITSKYGSAQLNKNASGSVVRYIEAPGIKKSLIPILPESFQQEVDDLIQESARLREEAADALQQAIQQVEDIIPYPSKKNVGCVSSRTILSSHNKRFEANYYISEGHDIEEYIYRNFKWKPLGQVCEDISRPDIFKRYYVQNGIVFLGGADIFLASPDSKKQLSKTKTTNITSLAIKENTILIPRSGTIGNVAWAHAGHAQKLASEHVIRLQPNDILRGGYIYAFLSSSIGKALIQKHIFGSVIQHIEPPHLKLNPIPILEESIIDNIHKLVLEYSKKVGKAIENERQAISMIEQEIESWTK